MVVRTFNVALVAMLATCVAATAADRPARGVPAGIEKPLLISPRPGNGRNSEGDFVRLRDGRLMLVYTKFEGKGDHAAADLVARFSSDEGKTWTTEDVPVVSRDEHASNLMSVSLLRLNDDRIALFYIQKYASPPEAKYPFLDHLLMRTSSDEATTWSEPVRVSPRDESAYRVLNNDRVIQLKSGRLVAPVATHYEMGWSEFRNSAQIHCYLSDDLGATWKASRSTLESELVAQEPGVVELKDGRILLFCRSSDCELVSESSDGGDTWSELRRSNISQPTTSPASIERIPSTGDLLMVWNNGDDPLAKVQPVGRRPFSVAISDDDGATWKHVQNIGTDPEGWYCYTAIQFVGDHVVLGHCEYPRLNSLQVTRFPVSWLYESHEPSK